MRSLPALMAALLLVACGKAPEKTALQLRDDIRAAAKAAEASVTTGDEAAAEAAATRATAALEQLRQMHAQAKPPAANAVDTALLTECEAAARSVGRWGSLTKEKAACKLKLAGWKARAYYAVDAAVWTVFLHGLALAAEQADAGNLKLLPQAVQDGAATSAGFIESYIGPQRHASGELDWQGVSRELKKLTEMPSDMRVFLAFMLVLGMEFDAAFYEIEAVQESALKTPEQQAFCRLVRGLCYAGQGYGQLAFIELESAEKLSTDHQLNLDPAAKCGLHLLLAGYFLKEKRWSDADRCLASANRVWPDNPLVVFLTGERQIATNNYAAAEQSLVKAVKGTRYAWLAEKVAARVKLLRDNPAALEPVVFDFNLMADLAWAFVEDQSPKSPVLKSIHDWMKTAQAYTQELKQKLPDLNVNMPALPDVLKWGGEPAGTPK